MRKTKATSYQKQKATTKGFYKMPFFKQLPLGSALKKASLLVVFLGMMLSVLAQPVIPERPQPPKLVNDLAGILKPNEAQQLERRLLAYNDSTSTQITVVTVQSLGGEEASFFAFQLGEKWGVGQAEEDNGIVILIAPKERKAFIATGYGTEGAIPDAYAKRIVENLMIPEFRTGKYYNGIVKAVEQIRAYLKGEFTFGSRAKNNSKPNSSSGFFLVLFLFVFFIFLFSYLASKSKTNGYTYSGKGVKPFSKGNGPVWGGGTWSSGGSFGGGGGFGSGGSSAGGGGFGGFGGGSFGGGGAGGSW